MTLLLLSLLAVPVQGQVEGGQVMTISGTKVSEGDSGSTAALFTVELFFPSDGMVQVEFRTLDGSATASDRDYTPVTGLLVFPQGVIQRTISVQILGDLRPEADEEFLVELFNPVGAGVFDPFAQGLILNDDLPSLSLSDTSVVEGDRGRAAAVFTAVLSAPSAFPVTARYATADGTATAADDDYAPSSGQLTIPAGRISGTFVVFANGDTRPEEDETFEVVLASPTNATLDDSLGIATILDDDAAPLPSLSVDDIEVQEGDAGTVLASFPVRLSQPSEQTVTVGFATGDGTATEDDSDYLGTTGTLTFPPGEVTGFVEVEVAGDLRDEDDETFFVELLEPVNATLDDGQGVGTIRDDDEAGELPTLSIDDVEVQEGNGGTTEAIFTVRLSQASPSGGEVRVRFATADGTATTADGDYRGTSGELVFEPGETSRPLVVEVLGDGRPEADETFFVDLSEPVNATLADARGEGSILNDDVPEISISDAEVTEGDSGTVGAVFQITLSQASAEPVTVAFASRDGAATAAGGDYRQTTGERTFSPGQTAAAVTVEVVGDLLVEGDETFFVDLSEAVNATLADAVGQGTIRDDDEALGRIRLLQPSAVPENAGRAVVEVQRTTPAAGPATVRITAGPATAQAGEDFTPITRTLEWGPGESGIRRIAIDIVDDRIQEGTEALRLRLSRPTGAELGQPSEVELTILDDDTPLELTASGETSLSATVGQRLELEVQVRSTDGVAVAGVAVEWSLEGDGELPEGDRSTTDDDGRARAPVQLGATAGVVRVTARIAGDGGAGSEGSVAFEIRVRGNLGSLFDSGANPGEASVAEALDEACITAGDDLGSLCDYLFTLEDPGQQVQAVEALTPKEVSAQATLTLNAAHIQLKNVGARQAALRRAGRGSSAPGPGTLTVELRGESLRIADLGQTLAPALLSDAEFEAAVSRAFFQDQGGAEEIPEVSETVRTSRLGLFVNGSLALGDRPASGREAGFDFETGGLTAGLDYRLTDRFFFGGAVGYLDTGSDVHGGGGLDTDGFSLLGYASYYVGGFYLDTVVGYGRTDYHQVRSIDLPRPFQGQSRLSAEGDADGRQLSASLRLGYDLQRGATTFQGFGGLSAVDAEIDAYQERGAGSLNLSYAGQDSRSLLSEIGLEVAYAASFSFGVLRPTARASFLHEFEDDIRRIRARFTADRSGIEFGVPTEAPDRNYFNLAAGLTATLTRGRTVYLTYEREVGRDDLDQGVLAAGFRLEL